jgi:hypothetical protein
MRTSQSITFPHGLRARYGLLLVGLWAILPGCDLLNSFSAPANDTTTEKEIAKKPAPPSKYSFRQPPYIFSYDFDLQRDQPLFKDLDGLRDQLAKELHIPAGTTSIQVYLFEDRQRFEKYMASLLNELPTNRRAFMIAWPRQGAADEPIVYTFWGKNERIQQDLRHELTHALLRSVLREVPMWLDEGLAEYFELPAEAQNVNGAHVEVLRRAIRDGSFKPDLARLEGLTQVKQMNSPEYREAWAWVHLLLRSTPEAKRVLRNYLAQLKTNPNPGMLAPRLAEVFPSPEEALKKHLLELEVPEKVVVVSPPEGK